MYLGIPTILAVLVSLESFSAAKNIAYFYSGDDCKNWNETLASTGRHMDSVRYGGQGCITGPDEDGIPPRKFVWIPSGKDRKYCLHMSTRDTDICGDMDCSFGHAKNLHVHGECRNPLSWSSR